MKLLVDTHLLLWAAEDAKKLPRAARAQMAKNELLFSVASLWEIAIKRGLGRRDFRVDVAELRRGLLENDYMELSITGAHAAAVDALPPIHKDPFDRMLIAQAVVEKVSLLTADRTLARYGDSVLAV
jgi:PIN domain nuclease of toxin-antitoxin system